MKSALFLVLALGLFSHPAKAQDGSDSKVPTGIFLRDMCERSETQCKVFLSGFLMGLRSATETDIPRQVTGDQLGDVVIKYMKDHPEKLHESMSTVIIEAILDAWPPKVNTNAKN
jgi:hypothetical protein